MKYFLIVLAAILAISCNEENNSTGTTHSMNDSAKAAVMNDSSSYTTIEWIDPVDQDLGKINKGQVLEVSWRFRNTGNKPLVVSNVAAGCGCTVADKPEEPIAPGAEGRISAKFDSQNQSLGTNHKNMTVIANTKGKTAHYLTFKVELQ